MTVAIGCTGGKHRSVAMAEEIAAAAARARASTPASCTATWARVTGDGHPRWWRLGGGHGLAASLSRAAPRHRPT